MEIPPIPLHQISNHHKNADCYSLACSFTTKSANELYVKPNGHSVSQKCLLLLIILFLWLLFYCTWLISFTVLQLKTIQITLKRIEDHLSPVDFGQHGTHTSHPCLGGEVIPSYGINLLLLCIQSALPYIFQVFIRYQSLPPPNTSGHMSSSLSGTTAAPFTGVNTHLYSPITREGNTTLNDNAYQINLLVYSNSFFQVLWRCRIHLCWENQYHSVSKSCRARLIPKYFCSP